MLVLTRKTNQAIHIGEDIRIVVVAIEGGQVKLGIEAPAGVSIKRPEAVEKPAKAQAAGS